MISKDIALQVRNLLPEQREYQKKWYPVLEKCYEADPSEEMVAAICTYLIRGQQWFPSDESLFWGMYNRPYNQVPTWHLQNYWTEERPNAYLPRYVGYYGPMNANTVNVNTRYLQDVSYIRLKNLQFGYELPKRWISKIGLSKVSVYFSGENLWSWSPLYRHTKDFDVTVASKKSDSDISNSKGDGHNYPVMRSFSFGISITY